jgi:CubicO group peptidase (beta-lactamase class C family)
MPNDVGRHDPENPQADYDNLQLFAYLAKAELTAAPGSRHLYSNLGAALLGQALAARAGKPYEELVRSRILEPLGMRASHFSIPKAASERVATGHDADGQPRPGWDFKAFAPAGGLKSTARDMARFAAAAAAGAAAPLDRALLLAKADRAEANAGRRIGLFFQTRPDGVYWHNGSTGGFSSYMALDPARKTFVVVLTSSTSLLTDTLGDKISSYQRGEPLEPFDLPEDERLSVPELAEYEGTYVLAEDFLVRVFREGDVLYARATGQEALRIWPSGDDRFYFRVVDAKLVFERGANRKIVAVILDQDGELQRAVRRLRN